MMFEVLTEVSDSLPNCLTFLEDMTCDWFPRLYVGC